MFTGLIEATARIGRLDPRGSGLALRCLTPLGAQLSAGESIAVNGVCLTVVRADGEGFDVELSPETLRVTTFGELAIHDMVNLERPLRADARIGGHFVLGHVDGVGRVDDVRDDGDHHWIDVAFSRELASAFIPKGSVAVNGVSLTIAALKPSLFGVQIVPFTWAHTTFSMLQSGDRVNLETDVIGKYVARLLAIGPEAALALKDRL